MNGIDRWFDRMGRTDSRTVSLYASLLTQNMVRYFWYRLRYALLVDGITFVVHVAEFLIILTSLGGLAAFTVMLLRVGSLIISGAWWGLLEIMRERLREFSASGDREAIDAEIGSWLRLSALVAGTLTVSGSIALLTLAPSQDDPLGRFYAFLVLTELVVRIPLRVLHSGMFATQRIYRPSWSLFAPAAAQVSVLGVGALFYPTAAVIVAIVVSNAISIWITVHFTLRVYRLNGLTPRWRPRHGRLPVLPPRRAMQATLAGLGFRLDAVAVLAIAGVYGTSTRSYDLTAGFEAWRDIDAFQFFYLVLPLLRGAYDTTAVFYFDFVRLRRIPALREYRVWFFHRLLWITPIVTLYFWALAAALGMLVLPDVPITFLLALLPLFLTRSFIGTYQVRLFAEGRFGALNATFALSGVLFALVWIDVDPASDLVELTAAMLVLLVVHINVAHLQDRRPPRSSQLPLGDWLRAIAEESGPVRAGTITVPEWIPARQRSAAVEMLRNTLADNGVLAFTSATTLIFYERDPGDSPPLHLWLQDATGGAAHRGRCWRECADNGAAALARIVEDRWLTGLTEVPQPPTNPRVLRAEFLSTFPDGLAADVSADSGRQALRQLDHSLLATILPAAMRSLDDDALVVSVAQRWVSPIFHHNRVRMVFVLPPDPHPAQFRRWLQTLRAWRIGNWPEGSADRAC